MAAGFVFSVTAATERPYMLSLPGSDRHRATRAAHATFPDDANPIPTQGITTSARVAPALANTITRDAALGYVSSR
jgi:hypothetical protein